MKKAIHILTTILILSIAAGVYCFVAPPLLEPESKYQKTTQIQDTTDISKKLIETMFQPDAWELTTAQTAEINGYYLYIGEHTFPEGQFVKFKRCSIVKILSTNPFKSILVQCAGDVEIEFDQPILSLNSMGSFRFVRCTLNGEINIKSFGDPDNLSIKTRDLHVSPNVIGTTANIHFKYGQTQGVGSGLQIQFISSGLLGSGLNTDSESQSMPNKIENITLQKLHRLTIVPPKNIQKKYNSDNFSLFSSPIEVRCDGPFVFNALNKKATFNQNVSLIQSVANKMANTIRCQYLNLYFKTPQPPAEDNVDGGKDAVSESERRFSEWNLQLDRLDATGPLVVLEAPEYQTRILANHLIGSISPLRFELDSTNRPCEIYYKNHVVSTRNVIYEVGKDGSLGSLECNSPGWIKSKIDPSGKQVRVRWQESLNLKPDKNDAEERIVSLTGNALMQLERDGVSEASITASSFFFWLSQQPALGKGNFTLSRMQANDNVILKSNPITASVKTMQLWFEQSDKPDVASSTDVNGITGSNPIPDSSSQDKTLYNIFGSLLQGRILINQNQVHLNELTLKDNVRIYDVSTTSNGSASLEMNGDQIQLFDVTSPSATASLIGEPAKIRYNNVAITGDAINVNRGLNKIWIDTYGAAMFNGDPENQTQEDKKSNTSLSLAMTEPAKIQWKKSMVLQNDILTFNGNVSLQRKDQFAQCDTLAVILNQKIDLQNLKSNTAENSDNPVDVKFIVLNNAVKLENHTAENGITTAIDCLTASKLTINMKKQTFVADGPGRAMTQRKSGNENEPKQPADSAIPDISPPTGLINLCVDFQKQLEGSFDTRSMQTFLFSGRVEAEYAPIDEIGKTFKTHTLDELPPDAFKLTCGQMEIQTNINQIASVDGSGSQPQISPNSAFIASGGVKLEGRIYNATADKITYEAKNDTMKIEGNGQTPANFFYQKVTNGRYNRTSSSAIYYNIKTGAVRGEGMQEFSLFINPSEE